MHRLKRFYDWLTMDYSWYYELYKAYPLCTQDEVDVLRKFKNKEHLRRCTPELTLESFKRLVTLRECVRHIQTNGITTPAIRQTNGWTNHLILGVYVK